MVLTRGTGPGQKIDAGPDGESLSHNFFRGLLTGLFHLKTGDAAKANQILASYEAVTEADILRVAQTYLREDNRTVVILKPVPWRRARPWGRCSSQLSVGSCQLMMVRSAHPTVRLA